MLTNDNGNEPARGAAGQERTQVDEVGAPRLVIGPLRPAGDRRADDQAHRIELPEDRPALPDRGDPREAGVADRGVALMAEALADADIAAVRRGVEDGQGLGVVDVVVIPEADVIAQ